MNFKRTLAIVERALQGFLYIHTKDKQTKQQTTCWTFIFAVIDSYVSYIM